MFNSFEGFKAYNALIFNPAACSSSIQSIAIGHFGGELIEVTFYLFIVEAIVSLWYSVLIFNRVSELEELFLSPLLFFCSKSDLILPVQFGICIHLADYLPSDCLALLVLGHDVRPAALILARRQNSRHSIAAIG